MFQSFAESIQSDMADLPHIAIVIMILISVAMFYAFNIFLRKFLVMFKTPTSAIKDLQEGMLAEIIGLTAPNENMEVLTEPFSKQNVVYLSIEAGVMRKRLLPWRNRRRRYKKSKLDQFEGGSKDFFSIKDDTGKLMVANESFMNGLKPHYLMPSIKKKDLTPEILAYFPNSDLPGQTLITGWRLRYYFIVRYIPVDEKVIGVGVVKTVSVEGGTPKKMLHGGEDIDLKRLSARFFKPTINQAGIIENFPDRQEVETMMASGRDASKKEKDRALLAYGSQGKQLAILLFQTFLLTVLAVVFSGFTSVMIYSKYIL
ncbi:MAG: hypothetical protein AAFQ94_25910 [Bacteroidota bacterium]